MDDALAVEEECEGAIEGMLEQINLHHGANVFYIYPEIGPRKISCHFPPSSTMTLSPPLVGAWRYLGRFAIALVRRSRTRLRLLPLKRSRRNPNSRIGMTCEAARPI